MDIRFGKSHTVQAIPMSPLTIIIMNAFKFYIHVLNNLMVYFLCSYNNVVNTLILCLCCDVDLLCFCSVLCLLCLCARLFICAL